MDWVSNHLLPRIESGQHPYVKPEWSMDTYEIIAKFMERYPEQVDLEIMHAIGRAFPSIIRGTVPILQLLIENDRLQREYKDGLGFAEANSRLGSIVNQLSHQYPRMQVLEIGAGTGGATEVALRSLGVNFESYAFTDISPGFFERAQHKFSKNAAKLKYAVLDIERPPREQGFEEHSFDLVIASNVLHATKSLSSTMQHCRQLLRPGGRMILLEITSETLHTQFIVCGLPGWWLGREDGRVHCPTVSEAQWDIILRDHGFSGVDSACRDVADTSYHTFSIMVTQALDSRISVLREPLMAAENMILMPHLVIVGGTTESISNATSSISRILGAFAKSTTLLNDIESVRTVTLEPGAVIICVSDLDEPIFKRMNGRILEAIQFIFGNASHVLWVTKGCRTDDPYANMMVGLGRSASFEYPLMRIQFVDIDSFENSDLWPAILSKILLRMFYLDFNKPRDILWSMETELAIIDGNIHIPRIIPDDNLNLYLNSENTSIKKSVSPASTPVTIVNKDSMLTLKEDLDASSRGQESVQIQVHSSSLFAYHASKSCPVHVCIGTLLSENRKVLVMSPRNTSIVHVPHSQIFHYAHTINDSETLEKILKVLLAESFFEGLTETLWVHDADAQLAKLLSMIAKHLGLGLFLSTSVLDSGRIGKFIHRNISQRALKNLIPVHVQRFVSMATGYSDDLEDLLVSSCGNLDIYRPNREAQTSQEIRLFYGNSKMGHIILRETKPSGLSYILDVSSQQKPLDLSALTVPVPKHCCTNIINWQTPELMPVEISPLTAYGLFSDKKTYFLIGLAGDLGMSLVEWMTDHGARYFAIASRKPSTDPGLLSHLHKKGAHIRLFPLDVSDKKALGEVHSDIVLSMPPIAGVANAAMVLRDRPLSSMSIDDLETVLRPKVDGSKNLDELFCDDELEFFILFSSMASVVGNPAQSNYGAANMFMSTLAAQRRQRGVAASVISIAMLLGIGYVARSLDTDSTVESQLRKFSCLAMSESDFHNLFAEAVRSGRPGSGKPPELLTGFENNQDVHWLEMARFSHFYDRSNIPSETQQKGHSNKSLKSILKSVQDAKEALQLLEDSFLAKLELILQISAENVDKAASLMKLGVDSLVAVEIRSWFLKELGVDLPVFKLLGGTSAADICRDALMRLIESSKAIADRKLNSPNSPDGPLTELPLVASLREGVNDGYETIETTKPESHKYEDDSSPFDNSGALLSELEHKPSPKIQYQRIGELSPAQARLYFLCEYLEDKSTHNVGYIGKIDRQIDIPRLKDALHKIYMLNEGLRSSYFIDTSSGLAIQAVNTTPHNIFEHKIINDERKVSVEVNHLKSLAFEIERGCVMKVVVLSCLPNSQYILIFHHHIILDGTSWPIFISDLSHIYSGNQPRCPNQQPIDSSIKKRQACIDSNLQKELAFWKDMHRNHISPLPLFTISKVKCRQVLEQYDTETFNDVLSMNLVKLVKHRAAEFRITPFHFYLSTFAVFLARCLDIRSLGIGIVDANRTDVQDQATMGYFLNVLPLQFHLKYHDRFEEVAKRTRDTVLAALSNSKAPFDSIIDHLQVPRLTEHHPLFQVLFNYRNGYETRTAFGNSNIHWIDGVAARNPYDITVDITETRKCTLLHFTTQKYLYSSTDSQLLMKWYIRALEGLADHPSTTVPDCPLSNEADLCRLISLGRGATVEPTWCGTIIHRIEEMVEKYPNSPALKDDYGKKLTYLEMMARADAIAIHLSRIPLARGSRVAMLLDPMADHVCCLIAVMKLGLVWIPLDLRNHTKRLSSMVMDCQPDVVVCNSNTLARARQLGRHEAGIVNLDNLDLSQQAEVENQSELNQPAVILYTSGSTGAPKGVLLTHRNILLSIFASTQYCKLGQEIVLQQSALSFDLSLDQTFHALANGGMLVIVGKDGRGDPVHLAKLIWSENVTYTCFVTSEYLSILNYGFQVLKQCTSWRFAVSLGEKMSSQLRRGLQRLNLSGLKLINAYGPTEATIACARGIVPYRTEEDVSAQNDCLWPMPGYSILVVDEKMNICPFGYPGEICISGSGLAIGYLNRPTETDHAFVEVDIDPMSDSQRSRQRLYRTGDSGRILEDGSLNVLGRIKGDSQVKIRGIRIELNEIVTAIIESAPSIVANAAASYRPDTDTLVAFVILNASFLGNKAEFAESLKTKLPLPSYMCPSIIVAVDEVPVNINGKQDRVAIDRLPIPIASQESDHASESLTRAEQQLREVWKEVLSSRQASVPLISSSTDFFLAGGNSMLVIKLRMLIRRTFGIVISLPDLFQLSKFSDMAARVEAHHETSPIKSIDWNTEITTICDGLPRSQNNKRPTWSGSPKIVLLTGATGFLGTRILQHLVDDMTVESVHCVAIRGSNAGGERHVSVHSSKIVEHVGDLSAYCLGLPEEKFQFLAEHVDLIIHNGAEVTYLKTYHSLRSTNVISTQTLAKLAIPRCIPLHYVSTAAVASITGQSSVLTEVSVSECAPPSDAQDGYAISKWVSESFLERVALEHDVPIWIHRPTTIVGPGAPELDLMSAVIKYSRLLRSTPRVDALEIKGAFDLIHVEDVSQDLVDMALKPPPLKQKSLIKFVHHCNKEKVAPDGLKEYLELMDKIRYEDLSIQEWLQAALAKGLNPLLVEYIQSIVNSKKRVDLPMIMKGR